MFTFLKHQLYIVIEESHTMSYNFN